MDVILFSTYYLLNFSLIFFASSPSCPCFIWPTSMDLQPWLPLQVSPANTHIPSRTLITLLVTIDCYGVFFHEKPGWIHTLVGRSDGLTYWASSEFRHLWICKQFLSWLPFCSFKSQLLNWVYQCLCTSNAVLLWPSGHCGWQRVPTLLITGISKTKQEVLKYLLFVPKCPKSFSFSGDADSSSHP